MVYPVVVAALYCCCLCLDDRPLGVLLSLKWSHYIISENGHPGCPVLSSLTVKRPPQIRLAFFTLVLPVWERGRIRAAIAAFRWFFIAAATCASAVDPWNAGFCASAACSLPTPLLACWFGKAWAICLTLLDWCCVDEAQSEAFIYWPGYQLIAVPWGYAGLFPDCVWYPCEELLNWFIASCCATPPLGYTRSPWFLCCCADYRWCLAVIPLTFCTLLLAIHVGTPCALSLLKVEFEDSGLWSPSIVLLFILAVTTFRC